jgi:hypothetical protein
VQHEHEYITLTKPFLPFVSPYTLVDPPLTCVYPPPKPGIFIQQQQVEYALFGQQVPELTPNIAPQPPFMQVSGVDHPHLG